MDLQLASSLMLHRAQDAIKFATNFPLELFPRPRLRLETMDLAAALLQSLDVCSL